MPATLALGAPVLNGVCIHTTSARVRLDCWDPLMAYLLRLCVRDSYACRSFQLDSSCDYGAKLVGTVLVRWVILAAAATVCMQNAPDSIACTVEEGHGVQC
jgi:hypothetical protein